MNKTKSGKEGQKMYRRQFGCLISTLILLALVSVSLAGTVSNEARRYMSRGIAAAEMAKSASDYDLAVKEFEKAARLAPDWPDIYYNLGSVQAKAGDLTSAMKSFQRYLDLAPESPDAAKVQEELFKLEYRRDREKLATTLAGTWTGPNGQTFELKLEGSHLLLTRGRVGDDICDLRVMYKSYPHPMVDVPLVFAGTLVGEKISGQYLQMAMKTANGGCDIPERKGNFEGTVDVAAGQIRIVYNRVKLDYQQEFKSWLSDEWVCWQTNRQETPGYVLELKSNRHSAVPNSGNASVPGNITGAYLGVKVQSITEELGEVSGLHKVKGAFVKEVIKNSPAEQAGLKSYDIILTFDGKEINDGSALPPIVAATPIGKTVEVSIYRDRQERTVKVKIGNLQSAVPNSGNASVPSLPTGVYQGTRTYENGDKYVGDFVKGKLNGKGTYTYANGNKYVGDFVDNKFHGKGSFICSNGKQYMENVENIEPIGFTIKCN